MAIHLTLLLDVDDKDIERVSDDLDEAGFHFGMVEDDQEYPPDDPSSVGMIEVLFCHGEHEQGVRFDMFHPRYVEYVPRTAIDRFLDVVTRIRAIVGPDVDIHATGCTFPHTGNLVDDPLVESLSRSHHGYDPA